VPLGRVRRRQAFWRQLHAHILRALTLVMRAPIGRYGAGSRWRVTLESTRGGVNS
jgi:hypothetical protein